MKEIVLITGYPRAGKTTLVQSYIDQDYKRFNLDLVKGSIEDLHTAVETYFKSFKSQDLKVVLDNTYATIESRASIIKIAKTVGASITCILIDTSIEDAQMNAVAAMVEKYGKLLDPKEMIDTKDPNTYGPVVQYVYKKKFQKPTITEGFDKVTIEKFVRRPYPKDYTNKALILDYDGNLRITKSGEKFPRTPNDIQILPGRKEKLQEYIDKGYVLLGVSNQSGVGKKQLSHQDAIDCFNKTNELLGHKIDVRFCPHSVPPIICYCRKPLAGIGVELIHQYKLDPKQCIFVGDATSDKTFASRAGFNFFHTDEFFKEIN